MNLKIFIKSVTYSAIFFGITLLSDYLTAWRSKKPFEPNLVASVRKRLKEQLLYTEEEADFMFSSGKMENRAYNKQEDAILMLDKGRPCPLESLSDHLNHRMLSESVSKYFIAYPKELA